MSERIAFKSAGATRKVRKFEIATGEVLGVYEARSVSSAIDAMARDWGFSDYNAMISDYGVTREEAIAELQITEF